MKWMQEFNFLSLHWQADLLLGPFCAYWSVLQCHDPVPGWLPGAHSCPPCLWFQQMVSEGITISHRLLLQSLHLLARLMSNGMFLFRTQCLFLNVINGKNFRSPENTCRCFHSMYVLASFGFILVCHPRHFPCSIVQDPGSLVSVSDKLQLLLSILCQAVLIWLSRSSLCWSHLFSLQWEVLLCEIRALAFILVSGSFLWL